jgi:hypothetical protein
MTTRMGRMNTRLKHANLEAVSVTTLVIYPNVRQKSFDILPMRVVILCFDDSNSFRICCYWGTVGFYGTTSVKREMVEQFQFNSKLNNGPCPSQLWWYIPTSVKSHSRWASKNGWKFIEFPGLEKCSNVGFYGTTSVKREKVEQFQFNSKLNNN